MRLSDPPIEERCFVETGAAGGLRSAWHRAGAQPPRPPTARDLISKISEPRELLTGGAIVESFHGGNCTTISLPDWVVPNASHPTALARPIAGDQSGPRGAHVRGAFSGRLSMDQTFDPGFPRSRP